MGDDAMFASATELLHSLFRKELSGDAFNSDVVAIVRKHLGAESLHSRAGNRLAEELVTLAKRRAAEGR